MVRRAKEAETEMTAGGRVLFKRSDQPGFADARLAGQDHDAPLARPGLFPAPQQQLELFGAIDERQLTAAQGIVAAIDDVLAQHHPSALGPASALQIRQRDFAALEQA